jgi:exodeoxyribonuclease VII large subunit
MGRIAKTQWDFDDLLSGRTTGPLAAPIPEAVPAAEESSAPPPPSNPPSPPQRQILSVSELTGKIRRLLETSLSFVWVSGEVTNLRIQSSGHIYFAIKDSTAQLSCVLFRGETQVDRALLEDGRKVTVRGEITVYEQRGQYQLRVLGVELEGQGALQAAFEKLKLKLKAEGLFASERKRPLPRFPARIGLVTSPTGAAIRDVLHVIERRHSSLEIILAPCRVQGDGAAREVAAAIRLLNRFAEKTGGMDLILVTRGGGSLEDLWAFNEEVVARAIFHSKLPVVSAVGHEIDFTISDFVADLRAATPSAAAEIITEGVFSSCKFLAEADQRLRELIAQRFKDKRYELEVAAQRLGRLHPGRKLNDWLQHLDDLQSSLSRWSRQAVRQHRTKWHNLSERLARVRPKLVLKQRRELLSQENQRFREQARHRLREKQDRLRLLESRLRLLGPEQVLARGYSITTDAESGKVVRKASRVKTGQALRTRLQEGEVESIAKRSMERNVR